MRIPSSRVVTLVAALLLAGVGALAAARLARPARDAPGVVRLDPRLDRLLAPDTHAELLGRGFAWAEGPVWVPREGGFLLFSDTHRNRVVRWSRHAGFTTFMRPSGYTGVAPYGDSPGSNGLALDRDGHLLLAEQGDRRIARLDWAGGKHTLADAYRGRSLNSPNDLVVRSDGDVYFTDPFYGLPEGAEDERRELDFCGVYRWSRQTAEVTLLTAELTSPNGLAFSHDERTLYVSNSDRRRALWMAYPVLPDGTLGAGKVLRDVTSLVGKGRLEPDGLKVDRNGVIFATGPGGVHILLPDGTELGRIDVHTPTNLAWGEDGSVLYITAGDRLFRMPTRTRGAVAAERH